VFLGLNLAVVFGFGLIVFALLEALIYNQMCRTHEADNKEVK
jgi:TRAP-type C4-dicarboxylate transport system permease small subunit